MAVIYLMPLPFQAITHVIQGTNDASWQMWWLWWAKESVSHGHSPYFTDRLLHPTGAPLYLSPTDMVTAFLSIPLQYLLGLVPTYNVLVFCSLVFSAWAMRRLALEVTGSLEGALVAGAAYAFMPLVSVSLNMGHLIWVDLGFMPLAVLGLMRLEEGRVSALIPRALPVSLAFLVSLYQGLFLLIFTLVYASYRGAVVAFERDWKQLRRFSFRLALWGALAIAFVAPILIPTLREGLANKGAEVRREWVALNSVGGLDPFLPNPLNPLLGGNGRNGRWEVPAFGYVLLTLAAVGALHARQRAVFWLFALLVFYGLSLGPTPRFGSHQLDSPFLPYNLLYSLPFGKIPRTPFRFLFLANLCLALLAAWGVACVVARTEKPTRPWPRWSVAVIGALLLIEFWPGLRPTDLMSVSPFYETLARSAPGAVLELPRSVVSRAMFWQTVHGHPILGGYFARYPADELRTWSVPVVRQLWIGDKGALDELRQTDLLEQGPPISKASEALDAYGVRYVVLHRHMRGSAPLEAALREALPPSSLLWEDDSLLAYRIPEDPGRTGVLLVLGLGWGPPQRTPPDPRLLHASKKESEVGLMLLDRDARLAELEILVSGRRRVPIALELNSASVTTLDLTPAPQTMIVPLRLEPGYNGLHFRALGKAAALPPGEDPDLLYLGRIRLRADPPRQPADPRP